MRGLVFIVAVGAVASLGCSNGDLGTVKGQVRLDGQPLPGAVVIFAPKDPAGSASAGKCDQEGRYELIYVGDVRGAELGEHIVRVTTYQRGDPDALPPLPALPERVPPPFNTQSQFVKKVEAGENTIDLDLSGALK